MTRERDDRTQPKMAMEDNNNDETTYTCQDSTNASEAYVAVGDNEDDDGIIFEEDEDEDKNKGYLFAGQDEETDEDTEVDGTQDDSAYIADDPDPYDKVYSNMPEETHMLKPVADCDYCAAKKFEYEPPGFCCHSGKIDLSPPETPDELVRMWSSADGDTRHF